MVVFIKNTFQLLIQSHCAMILGRINVEPEDCWSTFT